MDDVPLFHWGEFSSLVREHVPQTEAKLEALVQEKFQGKTQSPIYRNIDHLSKRKSKLDVGCTVQSEKPLLLELKLIKAHTAHCAGLCFDILKLRSEPVKCHTFKLLWIACIGMSIEDIRIQALVLRFFVKDVPCVTVYDANSIAVWVEPYEDWTDEHLNVRQAGVYDKNWTFIPVTEVGGIPFLSAIP